MTTPDAVADLLQSLLGTAEAVLIAGSRPTFSNIYITHGDLAWDCCDALVVRATSISAGKRFPAKDTPTRCAAVPTLSLFIDLLRCFPGLDEAGRPPSPATLTLATQDLNRDGWVLYHGLLCKALDGTLLPQGCSLTDLGGLLPLGPRDCAGWQIPITVQVLTT